MRHFSPELGHQLASQIAGKAVARDLILIYTSTRVLVRHQESLLEHQLSSLNSTQEAWREHTPIGYHPRGFEEYLVSQEASQQMAERFDYIQTAFAQALELLDDGLRSPADSEEWMSSLALERTLCPASAKCKTHSLSTKGDYGSPDPPGPPRSTLVHILVKFIKLWIITDRSGPGGPW